MPEKTNYFVDIHCHPTLKPYSKTFKKNQTRHTQASSIRNKSNLWFYNPPSFIDKIINHITTLVKYSQSDFTDAVEGNLGMLIISLYSPERNFFINKLGTGLFSDIALNIVTGLGINRINYIQNTTEYFTDLCNEYEFVKSFNEQPVFIHHKRRLYKILRSYSEIENLKPNTSKPLFIGISIEGAHCFANGTDYLNNPNTATINEVLNNIEIVKSWKYKPIFVTMAHHFYNGMCGQAKSLSKGLSHEIDQNEGLNAGFTNLGLQVLHKLLENENNNRILIDIKHMNVKSREMFYSILQVEYKNTIPIIVSHGAVTGLKNSAGGVNIQGSEGKFFEEDINFFDDELVLISKSGGIFGIQLDERRIACEKLVKKSKRPLCKRKLIERQSKLVWNQIEHIAKVLDYNNCPAWDITCIGSDFDGIVDPLDGIWSEKDFKVLAFYLTQLAKTFFETTQFKQQISPEELIAKIFRENAIQFLRRNYK